MRASSIAAALLATSVTLGTASPGVPVAAQSPAQRKCLEHAGRDAAKIAHQQARSARQCLRDAARGRIAKLGSAGNVDGCLREDPAGGVAKAQDAYLAALAKHCTGEAMPDFGLGAGDAAGREQALAMVADLLGPDPGAAVQPRELRPGAMRCQERLLSQAQSFMELLWKRARKGGSRALRGKDVLLGRDPRAPIRGAPALQTELLMRIEEDATDKLARRGAKLRTTLARHCDPAAVEVPVAEVFPGSCASAADLAGCIERVARARFWSAVGGAQGILVPCDLTDDGTFDHSCAEPALLEHVLARTGYGHDAWSLGRISAIGVEAYLAEQLAPGDVEEDPALASGLALFPSLEMSFEELRELYPRQPEDPNSPRRNDVPRELRESELLRRVISHRQLEAVLVDFWFNHLNVDGSEGRRKWDTTPYAATIRAGVLGDFGSLFIASARSPAMADYLDNRRNVYLGINENYSREAMELHSLSVAGPFTEIDVQEAARVLTGWDVDYAAPGGFRFRADLHDPGAKQVLDWSFPAGGGVEEGERLLARLSLHESTALFLATKLARRFVAEDPPDALVARVTARYLETGGDLRESIEALLLSPEFLLHTVHRRSKLKRPSQLWVSLARALAADPAALRYRRISNEVRDLGEELFAAPPPTGWPDVSFAWAGPGALVERLNELETVAGGGRGFAFDLGVDPALPGPELVDSLVAVVFPGGVAAATRGAAISYLDSLPTSGPEERLEQALAFLLSSPEFLLH